VRRDRDQAAINAAVQARQDELQCQFLTFQEQDSDDGRSHGHLRDSDSTDTASRHFNCQATHSRASDLEPVSAAPPATRSESAVLNASAPGFPGCYLLWL